MASYAERRQAGAGLADAAGSGRDTRRNISRGRLIAAAKALFFSRDYFSVAVDDIAKDAGLSRATFYLHYPGKEAILVDIVREESARLDPLYRWFKGRRATRENFRRFLALVVRLNRRSRRQVGLFQQASAFDDDVLRTFCANRDRHIAMLGEDLPAFSTIDRAPAQERRRRARANMLFYQLERFALYAAALGNEIDVKSETEALADAFLAYCVEYAR